MRVKQLEISGFKSFAKKTELVFDAPVSAIVGPNGSGKSNVVEALRFVLGEQSLKSMRGKRGEDLIWNGSRTAPRQNRASVSITFDNADRTFPLDYEEVTITREVYRDGAGEYFVNGSAVRLRDVIELLSSVHIGASGHHIISQGEADRILSASIKERRAMIEDALGLKIYQWKITESERKLEKTRENMQQVEILRKEIAPHIKFLKKQVEKIEQARTLRDELAVLYREYLKREESYLSRERSAITSEREVPEAELRTLDARYREAEEHLQEERGGDEELAAIREMAARVAEVRSRKDELSRVLGRIEGGIEYEERRIAEEASRAERGEGNVSVRAVRTALDEAHHILSEVERTEDLSLVRLAIERARMTLTRFIEGVSGGAVQAETPQGNSRERLETLTAERDEILRKLEDVRREESEAIAHEAAVKHSIETHKDKTRDAERALYEIRARKSELSVKLESLRARTERLEEDTRRFEEEVREGVVLVGVALRDYADTELPQGAEGESRQMQEDRRRKIERSKIRLEDMGGGGGEEIMKEYDDAVTRDEFLGHELEDLEKTADSLRQLIVELSAKLEEEFKSGITKINKQFNEFFALMFGGGSASLQVVIPKKKRRDDDLAMLEEGEESAPEPVEEEDAGIDISVTHPHKKIRGLEVLSGGERALTSIALLFAVSQVNPPPFLVLDETDAALDEANSRRYGDMLENLSKYSQLIVVTHNRETMSRASILYGVTMGSDAVSKLLSIKFDEAAVMAK